jgi:hypothetical protein
MDIINTQELLDILLLSRLLPSSTLQSLAEQSIHLRKLCVALVRLMLYNVLSTHILILEKVKRSSYSNQDGLATLILSSLLVEYTDL